MRASDAPPTVAERRDAVARRLEGAPGVCLCLDFDGTLAPIVDDPDDATIDGECRSLVADLAAMDGVTVGVISGRAIDDLRDRVGLDGVAYAGNHGLELRRGERTEVLPEAAAAEETVGAVCAAVEDRTASIPGCRVEDKGVTATVHYRRAAAVTRIRDAVEAAVADASDDLEVVDGKQIVEIRPRVSWDKGRVVAALAGDAPDGWETVYVGDDTTDEDAFEVVEPGGLGVLVGDRAETAASVRIPDQSGVPEFLALVAECQRGG